MNKVIGEMTIKVGKEEILLRPSFIGQVEIEDRAGMGLPALAQKTIEQTMGIKEIAAILYGGMVGALQEGERPKWTFNQFGEMVAKHNFIKLIRPATIFLGICLKGDIDEKKDEAVQVEPQDEPTV